MESGLKPGISPQKILGLLLHPNLVERTATGPFQKPNGFPLPNQTFQKPSFFKELDSAKLYLVFSQFRQTQYIDFYACPPSV